MKKLFFLLATIAMGASMSAQVSYEKVIATPEDWTGTYLIVCESQSVVFNGGNDTAKIDAKGGDAILQGVTFDESGVLASTEQLDTMTFTIEASGDTDWPWGIKSHSGLYLGHKDEDDNGLSTEEELKKKCRNTLAIDENGNFIATARYEDFGPYMLQYNKKAEQMRFRYFPANDKEAIQIYRRVAPTALENTASPVQFVKRIEKGQLVILKDGKKYNILGTQL